MLIDVGAVRQVDEDGVHVLDVCDDDGQVGQGGQRPGLVLILREQRIHSLRLSDVVGMHTHGHTHDTHVHKHVCTCVHMYSHTPPGKGISTRSSGTLRTFSDL